MNGLDLTAVGRFDVASSVADATDEALREAGAQGHERFVLWTGTADDDIFRVCNAYVPTQTGHKLRDGVCVTVDGEELHRLNQWLYENKQRLGAQVHSHPTRAYHSETDDTYPIATQLGALSIVVPHFGADGIRGRGVATYRLSSRGWQQQPWRTTRRLVQHEQPAATDNDSRT